MSERMKAQTRTKPLAGCVFCIQCANHTDPHPYGVWTVKALIDIGMCGCNRDAHNYGAFADRPNGNCNYKPLKDGE